MDFTYRKMLKTELYIYNSGYPAKLTKTIVIIVNPCVNCRQSLFLTCLNNITLSWQMESESLKPSVTSYKTNRNSIFPITECSRSGKVTGHSRSVLIVSGCRGEAVK